MMWQNRILDHSEVDPRTLRPHPLNPTIHADVQRKTLVALFEKVGWVQTILVNRRSGYVLDGHLRLEEALAAKETSVPVTWIDLDEDEERKVLALLNRLSTLAATDTVLLEELLAQVRTDAAPLVAFLDYLRTSIPTVSEPSLDLTPPNISAMVGDITFIVDRSIYLKWRESLYQSVGFSIADICSEIERRLGI